MTTRMSPIRYHDRRVRAALFRAGVDGDVEAEEGAEPPFVARFPARIAAQRHLEDEAQRRAAIAARRPPGLDPRRDTSDLEPFAAAGRFGRISSLLRFPCLPLLPFL